MGGSKGPSQSTINAQEQVAQEFTDVAKSQNARADTLFNNIGLPGLETAKSYYDKLASGDPNAIQEAVGPAEGQIDAQTAGTVKNIQESTPRGGVKLLAEDEAKIAGAGQKGNLITQAYTSAFPAEAQLGTGGAGLSMQAVAQAIQGFQGAGTTQAQVGQEQAQAKASQLGFFGALAGAGGEAAGAFCWIAEALWGVDDDRTHDVRRWLRDVYAQTRVGSVVVSLYRRFGRTVAAFLREHEWAKVPFRPLFEAALRKARGRNV